MSPSHQRALPLELGKELSGPLPPIEYATQVHDQAGDVAYRLRLRHEERREGLNLLGMPAEIFLEVHEHEVRCQRADGVDVRVLRSSQSWPVEILGEDAVVGDADDGLADAKVEQRFGQRRDERHYAARRPVESKLSSEDVGEHGAFWRGKARRSMLLPRERFTVVRFGAALSMIAFLAISFAWACLVYRAT